MNYPDDIRQHDHNPASPFFNVDICRDCGKCEFTCDCLALELDEAICDMDDLLSPLQDEIDRLEHRASELSCWIIEDSADPKAAGRLDYTTDDEMVAQFVTLRNALRARVAFLNLEIGIESKERAALAEKLAEAVSLIAKLEA